MQGLKAMIAAQGIPVYENELMAKHTTLHLGGPADLFCQPQTEEQLQKVLKLPFTVTDRARFVEGVLRGRTFRERYTILQYLYDRGKLEEYAEAVYDTVMEKYFHQTFKEEFPEWEG